MHDHSGQVAELEVRDRHPRRGDRRNTAPASTTPRRRLERLGFDTSQLQAAAAYPSEPSNAARHHLSERRHRSDRRRRPANPRSTVRGPSTVPRAMTRPRHPPSKALRNRDHDSHDGPRSPAPAPARTSRRSMSDCRRSTTTCPASSKSQMALRATTWVDRPMPALRLRAGAQPPTRSSTSWASPSCTTTRCPVSELLDQESEP